MPDATELWVIQGLGISSGPAFSFCRCPRILFQRRAPMRYLEAPARLAQNHLVTHRDGYGDTPSHALNSDTCLKVEMLPPEALKAYPGNARTHSRKQVRQI